MSDWLADFRDLPLALERRIDELCDEFEEALERGELPDTNVYLARIDAAAHGQLVEELTKLLHGYALGAANGPSPPSARPVPHDRSLSAHDRDSAVAPVGSTTRLHLQRSAEALRVVDAAGAKFAEALGRGELLKIEDIVASAPPEGRNKLLRELVWLEMEFRAKRGDNPRLEEYRQRFPDHARLVKYFYFENFIPAQLGTFSIQRLLGSGGFGHVYQGWDSKLSRSVAIKVFRRDPDQVMPPGAGLLPEARAAAQMRHVAIVAVHAILPDADGDEFLVMEYVDGRSLEDLLRSGPLSAGRTAELMLGVVEALEHSHRHGLIHRDLKPANILLHHGHLPRVTDFGLALNLTDLRRAPEIAGTVPYMAPEQASGETHRLDARTDLWAVGVTMYRALTGQLPFSGETQRELLDAICHHEAADLQQVDPAIPPELARIVGRCMMKRMSERYQSASELADDLRAYLSPNESVRGIATVDEPGQSALTVVPKGLRSFDANDRDFFLGLLPGPRDRHGIPTEVRFWEMNLRSLDSSQTFRVGLLYGPSGCGKSSLVRAGILPRLPGTVRSVIVDSTADRTEPALRQGILQRFPELPTELTLPAMLAELREGPWLHENEKLVIVFDQFEQWLHGRRQDESTLLVEALRQCDGGRVQALILVRDDFWMQTTRLFKQIDSPLLDGVTAAAVDLFDKDHALTVLAAFGGAYQRLPYDRTLWSVDQQRFLEHAVEALSDDGWITPVRLCIFAEMVKGQPWTPATLRKVRGTGGLGTVFLEQVFDSRSASPSHRLHRIAARGALERLLPPLGTDIRGHLVAESELQIASGYEHNPSEFGALMRCLDQELRIVTPSVPEADLASGVAEPDIQEAPRNYQLTHDFLVPAIRGWLNEARRSTVRGRAELRLSERAAPIQRGLNRDSCHPGQSGSIF